MLALTLLFVLKTIVISAAPVFETSSIFFHVLQYLENGKVEFQVHDMDFDVHINTEERRLGCQSE